MSFASGGTLLDEACWRVGGGGPLHAIGLEMGRITSAVALYLPRCVWAWGGRKWIPWPIWRLTGQSGHEIGAAMLRKCAGWLAGQSGDLVVGGSGSSLVEWRRS